MDVIFLEEFVVALVQLQANRCFGLLACFVGGLRIPVFEIRLHLYVLTDTPTVIVRFCHS